MPEVVIAGIKLYFSNGFPSGKQAAVVSAINALNASEAGRIVISRLPNAIWTS